MSGSMVAKVKHYGYGGNLQDVIKEEFPRIKGNINGCVQSLEIRTNRPFNAYMAALLFTGTTYLDHAATTLYPESLLRNYCHDISRNVYGERSHISTVIFMFSHYIQII